MVAIFHFLLELSEGKILIKDNGRVPIFMNNIMFQILIGINQNWLDQFKQKNEQKKDVKNKPLSSTTSSVVKKRKSNGRNKENAIEIIDLDEDLQEKRNFLEQELLNIQRQKNDELEREIRLIEKRNQMLGL